MELAVNYSPQAAGLLRDGVIAFDRWKCSDWPELIAGAGATRLPLYLHLDLQAGAGGGDAVDPGHIQARMEDTGTPYVNLHLAPRRADYPGIPVESREPGDLDAVVARTVRDIRPLVARFGAGRVIVENLPYRGPDGKRLRLGAEPAFMRRICDETGCGFLLDIAHARAAALHLGVAEREYLSSLPVDRLRELHVSGVDRDEDGRPREHMPLSADDWALLEWCLGHIRAGRWASPWALALEYSGIGPLMAWRSEPAVLAEQLPRLAALTRSLNAATPAPEQPRPRAAGPGGR